jgi:aminopeptidase N
VASLLRGFSAPVRLQDDLDDRQRAFLLQHDSDPFNRWEAGQQLVRGIILDRVGGLPRPDRSSGLPDGLIEGLRRILRDDGLDKGLAAEILSLPSELFLAEMVEEIDVEGIHAARKTVRRQLAEALKQEFRESWEKNRDIGPYCPQPKSVARRSLKNLCLEYLAALDEPAMPGLLADSYREAGNMTDRLAALSLLADCDTSERNTALEDFYRRAKGDPLVLDKWFAVQARSCLPDTLEKVRALALHPAFNVHNPNRVRSLFGVFSRGNPMRFHRPDGAGYAFIGDQVIRIDSANPQLAARLAGAFGAWRRYDRRRRDLMRSQLLRIQSRPGLSRDLSEVVSKALQES